MKPKKVIDVIKIDWKEKKCYYASHDYWEGKYRYDDKEYEIVEPKFIFDKFGDIDIEKD